jgi:hypothetical protein
MNVPICNTTDNSQPVDKPTFDSRNHMLATLIALVAFAIGLLYVRHKLGYVYRKLVVVEYQLRAANSIEQQLSRQFRQLEALIGLYTGLKPIRSLPETAAGRRHRTSC